MKSKVTSGFSEAENPFYETENSSGVLVYVIDDKDAVQLKFSQKIRVQLFLDNPFTKSGIHTGENENTIYDASESNDSFAASNDSQNRFNVSEDDHKKQDSLLQSLKLIKKESLQNGVNCDEGEYSHNFGYRSDTAHFESGEPSITTKSLFVSKSRRKRAVERGDHSDQEKYLEVGENHEGTPELDEDTHLEEKKQRRQLRSSSRMKRDKEIQRLKVTQMKTKQNRYRNPHSITLMKERESSNARNLKSEERKRHERRGKKKVGNNLCDDDIILDWSKEDERKTKSLKIDGDCVDQDENDKSRVKKSRCRPRKLLLEKNVKCKYCGVIFDTKLDFFNHRRMKGSSYACEICGKKEPFEGLLMVHMQTHKPHKGQLSEEGNENKKKLVKKKFKMKCDVCGLVVSSLDSLKIHTMGHTGEYPYRCCVCADQKFFSLSSLHHHLQVHLSSDGIQCKPCNMRFASRAELAKHQLTHEIKCGLCGEIFPNKTSRNCHYRTSHPNDILKCTMCLRMFATDAELQKHLVYHSKGKKEQCPECGVVVVKLKDHMILHSRKDGEKMFACDQCSMRYLSKSALQKHLLTHTGEKPYECNICSKRFRSHGMLRKHLLTHSLERKYVCDVCGKRCSLRSNLATHMRIHSNPRQFPCTFCAQAFNYKHSLQIHIRAKHSNQNPSSFTCPHCSQPFQDNTSLTSHILVEHSAAKMCQDAAKSFPPTSSHQELPQMVMETPSMPFTTDPLQAFHSSMNNIDPNLHSHSAFHMTNPDTLDMSSAETLSSLLNKPPKSHTNSVLLSSGLQTVAQGEIMNYLSRDRNSLDRHSSSALTSNLPGPPPLHLLPMSLDLHHASDSVNVHNTVNAPAQLSAHPLPSNNNGLLDTNNTPLDPGVSLGSKILPVPVQSSSNEHIHYSAYNNTNL